MFHSISKRLPIIWSILIFVIILGTPHKQAHAYLDPGSSSFLIQIIAASLLGLIMTLRIYSTRIMVSIRKLLGKTSETKADDDINEI